LESKDQADLNALGGLLRYAATSREVGATALLCKSVADGFRSLRPGRRWHLSCRRNRALACLASWGVVQPAGHEAQVTQGPLGGDAGPG
jgi:hypothetical protein